MIYGFFFCRTTSFSKMKSSIGSTKNIWKSHLSHTKCKWLAIASWLAMAIGWKWFIGWSMPIPTPIKAIMTLVAFYQMPNLLTTSSNQYPQM
jgi:MFS superfamily sulfate permease-like transporter